MGATKSAGFRKHARCVKKDLEWGTICELSWQRLEPFLSQAFAIRDNEQLIGITVTEAGIKGKIRYIDGTVNLREVPKKVES